MQVYELISSAEQETRNGNLHKSIAEYKDALTEVNSISAALEPKYDSPEVIAAVNILRNDLLQTIYNMELLKSNQKALSKDHSNKSTLDMESMFLSMKPSMNNIYKSNLLRPDANQITNDTTNDPILNNLLLKLNHNLLDTIGKNNLAHPKDEKDVSSEINRHIDQFKKELYWYEQKKVSEYDIQLKNILQENKKLNIQITKLRDRWNGLVESAKQKRSG